MGQVNCLICEKEFYAKPCHLKLGWGKYCSQKCRAVGQRRGRNIKCSICGKTTWKSPRALEHSKSGKHFCSKSCQTLWRNSIYSGKNHPNWRGGEGIYRKILRESDRVKECAKCGIKDRRILSAHHLDRSRKNNNLGNLIYLCMNCHFLVHRYDEKID